jgi:hypothetical protein
MLIGFRSVLERKFSPAVADLWRIGVGLRDARAPAPAGISDDPAFAGAVRQWRMPFIKKHIFHRN